MLKYKTKRIVQLDEWECIVYETYGKIYNFQQQDGCKDRGTETFTVPCDPYDYENDSIPETLDTNEMGVSFKSWLERDPNVKMVERGGYDFTGMWWERHFYPSLEMVAQDLYEKGLIEEGEYVIDIDW